MGESGNEQLRGATACILQYTHLILNNSAQLLNKTLYARRLEV